MSTMWWSWLSLSVLVLGMVALSNLFQGRQIRVREAWRQTLARAPRMTRQMLRASYRRRLQRVWESSRVEPSIPVQPDVESDPIESVWVDTLIAPARGGREPVLGLYADTAPDAVHPMSQHAVARASDAGLERGAALAQASTAMLESVEVEPMAIAQAVSEEVPPPPVPSVHAGLDARLDCIVELVLPGVVAKDKVLAALSSVRRVGSKPVLVEIDTGDGVWVMPDARRGAVHRLRAGVLLANRSGAINAMEYAEFADALEELAHGLGCAVPKLPEMAGVLQHAQALDAACAQFDVMIGVTVEAPAALSADEFASLATGLGLIDRGAGRYAALGAGVEPLFMCSMGERADQVMFVLEVARALPEAEPWTRMVVCARACAQRVAGRLVDDVGQALTEPAAWLVAEQLRHLYASLEEAGLDAGAPAALRVFN